MGRRQISIWITLAGGLWVGGWGWLMYRYPERIAVLNKRFGWSFLAGPNHLTVVKRMGLVEMALAALGVVNEVLALTFGWYR